MYLEWKHFENQIMVFDKEKWNKKLIKKLDTSSEKRIFEWMGDGIFSLVMHFGVKKRARQLVNRQRTGNMLVSGVPLFTQIQVVGFPDPIFQVHNQSLS